MTLQSPYYDIVKQKNKKLSHLNEVVRRLNYTVSRLNTEAQ